MKLKFLVDESSGKKLADYLREKDFDVVYIGDMTPSISDYEVLDKSNIENRILITNDNDFGELIFRLRKLSYGVVFLKPAVDTPQKRIELVNMVLLKFSDKLKGNFIVAAENKIRLKEIRT